MKKIIVCIMVMILLTGCKSNDGQAAIVMDLRQRITTCSSCEFDACIVADFGEFTYQFKLKCSRDSSGKLHFSVVEPESISGIQGTIDLQGGKIHFDNKALGFPVLADGELSPVSGPWIFLRGLQSGYLSSWGMDGNALKISIDDVLAGNPLRLDVWLNDQNVPNYAEVLWNKRRILSLSIENFRCM